MKIFFISIFFIFNNLNAAYINNFDIKLDMELIDLDITPINITKIAKKLSKNLIYSSLVELEDPFPRIKNVWADWQLKHIIIKNWFAEQEEKLQLKINETILYPFGGGDVLYPISFFPNFRELIIVALEPVGKGYSLEAQEAIFVNFEYLCKHGNFVTRDMEGFVKSGMLTMILLQLKKLGVKNLRYTATRKKIEFIFKMGGIERKVIYIKANLSDKFHKSWAWIFQEHNNFTLYIKSASFILHQPGFDKIKNLLMNQADMIIQDDTGFSYEDLKNNNLVMHLYGSYYLPYTIPGLKSFFQENLKQAYEVENVEALPFSIGYRSETVQGNLIIAHKKII